MTETPSSDLVISLPKTITPELFTDETEKAKLIKLVRKAVQSHVPDTSTKKGRDAIGSLARKVSSTKTVLINAGLAITEDWRKNTKTVNASRDWYKEELDQIRDEARQPLTDWENAEKARLEGHEQRLQRLQVIASTGFGQTTAQLHALKDELTAQDMSVGAWQEFHGKACIVHGAAVDTITRLITDAEKREAEKAELEVLRAEKEERDRIDREAAELERLDREAKEKAERERQAEEKRLKDIADAEARAREQAEIEAKERAEKAERDAKEAVERAEREKQEAIAKAESEKQEAIAAAARAEEDRKRQEEEERWRRQADEENQAAVMAEVISDLVEIANLTPESAFVTAHAIGTGRIRNTSIEF